MRKKIIFAIAIITLIVLIFMCVKINATSELIATYDISATENDNVTASLYQVDNNYTLVISGTGKMKDYDKRSEIPWSEYSGDWSTKLTKAIIEDGVENIGNNLFTLQKGLREVEIADTVTHIGAGVFSYCPLTEYFVIPDTVTSLGEGAFSNTGIVKIKLSNGLKEIQKSAFEDANIAEVDIPNSVEVIGERAFYLCTELTYVYIPESVKTIKGSAFTNCKKLECVEIASGVTTIEGAAFDYCGNLTKITIPSNVENIGSDTGDYWSIVDKSENITVYFKSGSAAEEYFAAYDKTCVVDDNEPIITNVNISETDWTNQDVTITVTANDELSGLSKYAYSFDGGLTWQEENFKTYSEYTEGIVIQVKDCLYNTVEYGEEITVYIDKVNPKINKVEISETKWTNQDVTITVTANDELSGLSKYAYSFDGGITWQEENSKTYQKNTNGIEIQIKDKAGNVTTHTEVINIENIDKVDPSISIVSGEREACISTVLTINATDNLSGFGAESYSFDNGATWQDSNQTEYKETTENIVIQVRDKAGNTTTYEKIDIAIGHNYDEEIIAPTCTEDGYTTHICTRCDDNYKDNYTDATGHTEVIDERVEPTDTETGLTQGSHCSVCNTVLIAQEVIPALRTVLETWDISETENDDVTAILYDDGTLIISGRGNMTDSRPWENHIKNIVKVEIEDGVTSIGNSAFWQCSNLSSIIIPETIQEIEYGAFYYCSNLTEITIPEGVTDLNHYIFAGCTSLIEITIPKNVTTISGTAFRGCSSLMNIYVDDDSEYYISDNGVLFNKEKSKLIKYPPKKTETEYQIPDGVISIEGSAFWECSNLINIIVPYGITAIGEGAFYNCSFTNIEIPNSVTDIGNMAFYKCSSLTSIEIPDSITRIKGSTFYDCSSLTSIKIPDSITSIDGGAFWNCSSLINIEIPNKVENIGQSAFSGCLNLINITIPYSVTNIGDDTFNACHNLVAINVYEGTYAEEYVTENYSNKLNVISIVETWDISATENDDVTAILYDDGTLIITGTGKMDNYTGSVEVPWVEYRNEIKNIIIRSGITNVGDQAFENCSNLTNVEIPEGVTEIGSTTFWNCSNLKNVIIPKTVTNIDIGAFGGCSSFTNIEIPEGVRSIGISTFAYCSSLTNIGIPESVTNIDNSAFYGCSSLLNIEIPDSVTNIGNSAFYGCSSLLNIKVPENVTNIGHYAFDHCSALVNVEIPKAVINIGAEAFSFCDNLVSINVDVGNNYYTSDNGILFNKDKTVLMQYPAKKEDIREYIIPKTVKSIGNCAFTSCENLLSIEIPEGVTSIGHHTFWNCKNLKNVVIPQGVVSIGEYAFYEAEKLLNIKITNGTIDIKDYAFYNCNSLSNIELPNTLTSIGDSVFNGCYSLKNITMPESITKIGYQLFAKCNNLTNINVYCNSYAEEYVTANYNDRLNVIHTYESVVTEPTCIERGYTTHTCTGCSDSYVDTYTEAKEHNFGEWTETKAATCEEEGSKERVCAVCQEEKETEIINALEHSYSEEWTIEVEPTCTEVGSKSHHCTRENCDSKIDITPIKALNHEYKIIDSSEAVCEQGGKITYECSHCKDTYDENVPAKGHTEVIDAAVEATCTEKGKTEGKHCSVCSKVLIAQEEIASIGHNFGDWTVTKEATCTGDGSKEKVCSVCQNKETEVITKLGHEYNAVVTNPTCTEKGYTTHICTKCSDSYIDTETDALGHNFGAWVIDKEPTYEEEGHKYRVCTNCNTEKEEQVIPNLTNQELEVQTIYTVKEQEGQKFVVMPSAEEVQEILSNITSNKDLEIVDKSGKTIEDITKVGTGAKVVEKRTKEVAYTIVVKGDANGDAKIDFINDIIGFNNYRLNIIKLDTASILAGDINEDGKIDFITDIIGINNYRLGIINSL